MPCKLQTTCADPLCHMCGPIGANVTLVAVGTDGTVKIASARYDGQELVAGSPVKEISFNLVAGRKRLAAAYVFSKGAEGRGELHERCSPTQTSFLTELRGDNPVRGHLVCGE